MGSIVSKIYDEIKLHGSMEEYEAWLKRDDVILAERDCSMDHIYEKEVTGNLGSDNKEKTS